jgi:PhnB protein
MAKPIPNGFHAVTPSFTLKNTKKALEFYQKAFGAKVMDSFPTLDGKGIMHAVMQIGDSLIMMGDEMPGPDSPKSAETTGGSPMCLFIYTPDADAVFKQAVAASGKVIMPMADMFWGDRAGTVQDPFGYQWMIATHTRDMTKDQITEEAKTFFAQASTASTVSAPNQRSSAR